MKCVHSNPVFTRRKIPSYWLFYLYSVFVGVCDTHKQIFWMKSVEWENMCSGSVFCSQLGSLHKQYWISLLEVRPLTVAQSVLHVSCNNFWINHPIFMTFHMNNSQADDIHFCNVTILKLHWHLKFYVVINSACSRRLNVVEPRFLSATVHPWTRFTLL